MFLELNVGNAKNSVRLIKIVTLFVAVDNVFWIAPHSTGLEVRLVASYVACFLNEAMLLTIH